jgi:hypothetical protein
MKDKKSKEVFEMMEKISIVGVVLEAIKNTSISRTKGKYQEIQNHLSSLNEGVMGSEEFQQEIEKILHYHEVILVTFKKIKRNGKVGCRKEFVKGFYYYIGRDADELSKIYVHWDEDKKFLLKNVHCLKAESFLIKKQMFNFTKNVFSVLFSLYDQENQLLANLCIYVGF